MESSVALPSDLNASALAAGPEGWLAVLGDGDRECCLNRAELILVAPGGTLHRVGIRDAVADRDPAMTGLVMSWGTGGLIALSGTRLAPPGSDRCFDWTVVVDLTTGERVAALDAQGIAWAPDGTGLLASRRTGRTSSELVLFWGPRPAPGDRGGRSRWDRTSAIVVGQTGGVGKRGGSLVLGVVVVVGAAGCWPAPGQNADRTSYNQFETAISVDTVGSLAEDWTATVDAGAPGTPVLSTTGVHVADGNAVYTFATGSGERRWRTQLVDLEPGFSFSTGDVFVDGDDVLATVSYHVLGGGGTTAVLDATTGAVERNVTTGDLQSVRSPQGAGVSTTAGTDLPRWSFLRVADLAAGTASDWGLLTDTGPGPELTLGTERLYGVGYGPVPPFGVGSLPPYEFRTFTQQGQAIRGIALSGGAPVNSCLPEGVNPTPETPAFVCGAWATPVDGTPTAVVIGPGEDLVYAGTSAGTVYALDATTGTVVWSAGLGSAVTAPPALAEGRLHVPTAGGLVVLDAVAGNTLWTADTTGSSRQPAVANGVVFTASSTGSLRAFPAAGCGATSCEPLWSASTGDPVTGAPALSAGRLFITTTDGRVISYT